jgi:hypothetical protein
MITRTYNVEDIFQDVDGEDDLCLMVIPEEILEMTGWVPGDSLIITLDNDCLVIKKKPE